VKAMHAGLTRMVLLAFPCAAFPTGVRQLLEGPGTACALPTQLPPGIIFGPAASTFCKPGSRLPVEKSCPVECNAGYKQSDSAHDEYTCANTTTGTPSLQPSGLTCERKSRQRTYLCVRQHQHF